MSQSPQLHSILGRASIYLFGHQDRIIEDEARHATALASSVGANADLVFPLIVAPDKSVSYFQNVGFLKANELNYGDGGILKKTGSAIVLQSADCPILVLHHTVSGRVVVVHAGRPALTPVCKEKSPACDMTIIEIAVAKMCVHTETHLLEALVVGNICGPCFKHDHEEAQHLIAPFLPLGSPVFANKETGSLDLFAVIKHRLAHLGVPVENIVHTGPCTFETPTLSSHRRGDKTRNTVIVVLGD